MHHLYCIVLNCGLSYAVFYCGPYHAVRFDGLFYAVDDSCSNFDDDTILGGVFCGVTDSKGPVSVLLSLAVDLDAGQSSSAEVAPCTWFALLVFFVEECDGLTANGWSQKVLADCVDGLWYEVTTCAKICTEVV